MNNLLNEDVPFKPLCLLNIFLAVLGESALAFSVNRLNDLIYHKNEIKLYRDYTDLWELFKDVFSTYRIEPKTFTPEVLDGALKDGAYILGLYDTFHYEANMNYKSFHNINTFLVYGRQDSGEYQVYIGRGTIGLRKDVLSFETLKSLLVEDLSRCHEKETVLKRVGLPCSILRIDRKNIVNDLQRIEQSVINYYLNTDEECGINGVCKFAENLMARQEKQMHYEIISNLSIYKDFIFLQAQRCSTIGYVDLLPQLNEIYRLITVCKNVYARYIFTQDHYYLESFAKHMRRVICLELLNQRVARRRIINA